MNENPFEDDMSDDDDATADGVTECFYTQDDESFRPRIRAKTMPTLPPGCYQIDEDSAGLRFDLKEEVRSAIVPDDDQQAVLAELDTFWKSAERYRKYGFQHRRGVLLHGPPGTGKSTTVRLVTQDVAARGGIALRVSNTEEFTRGLEAYRSACPELPVLGIIEDLDRFAEHDHIILGLLDGTSAVEHLVWLATTNHMDRLTERMIRPSRFDRHILIGLPTEAARRKYVSSVINDKAMIEAIVKDTEGEPIAVVKERILRATIFESKAKAATGAA